MPCNGGRGCFQYTLHRGRSTGKERNCVAWGKFVGRNWRPARDPYDKASAMAKILFLQYGGAWGEGRVEREDTPSQRALHRRSE